MEIGVFNSGDDLQRTMQAAKKAEELARSSAEIPGPQMPIGPQSVEVQITGDKITTSDPPVTDGLSEQGLWPGKFILLDVEGTSPDTWLETEPSEENVCRILELNDQDLVVGQKYKGTIAGIRNGYLLVTVEVTPGAAGTGGGDVWGPVHAFTGAMTIFSDPSGRFIKAAPGVLFTTAHSGNIRYNNQYWYAPGDVPLKGMPSYQIGVQNYPTQSRTNNANSSSMNWDRAYQTGTFSTVYDQHTVEDLYFGTACLGSIESFRFNNNEVNGFIYTELIDLGGGFFRVVRSHSSTQTDGMQYWMVHYTHDGVKGLTGAFPATTPAFKDGLFILQQATITQLSGGATLAQTISKVNEIIALLQSSGFTA